MQVRAEQALLAELESEWLNQFWVQGRRHAALHPWWRGPMALLLATWRELERRTSATVQTLLLLPQQQQNRQQEPRATPSLPGKRLGSLSPKNACGAAGKRNKFRGPSTAGGKIAAAGGGGAGGLEPAAIARAFDTVLRALEERKDSRLRWDSRFGDSTYRSLAADCAPVVPALWSEADREDPTAWERDGCVPLPKALGGVIFRLRECYTEVYRAASGGKTARSGKAIAAGAASNWELLRASQASPSLPPSSASPSVSSSKAKNRKAQKKKRKQSHVLPYQQQQVGGARTEEIGGR